MKNQKTKLQQDQKGFAALVIAIILVLVLSLITVGFAQLMRNEERSALDRHLSNQAFYAAEAGVNDAAKAINAGYTSAKPGCDPINPSDMSLGADFLKQNTVGNSGASYPCLLIDPAPEELDYSSIDFSQSKSIEITGVDPSNPSTEVNIDSLLISWQDKSAGTGFVTSGTHEFTTRANWPTTAALRLALTPLASGPLFLTRAALIDNTYTAYLFPNDKQTNPAPSSAAYPIYLYGSGSGSQGTATGLIDDGNCSTNSKPSYCNVTISGLGQSNYMINLLSLPYGQSAVKISAFGGASGTQRLRIKNAQTLVDSTGKAQDVLRRVQVRIPSHNNYSTSDYGLHAMDGICKQLTLLPASIGSSVSNCTP